MVMVHSYLSVLIDCAELIVLVSGMKNECYIFLVNIACLSNDTQMFMKTHVSQVNLTSILIPIEFRLPSFSSYTRSHQGCIRYQNVQSVFYHGKAKEPRNNLSGPWLNLRDLVCVKRH
jgi:hypothetical protein